MCLRRSMIRSRPNHSRQETKMAILSKPTPPPLSEQRVQALQDEINAFIDARADALKAEAPNVPTAVLRNIICSRSGGCACRTYLQIKRQDGEEAERAKQ
jgi:hypothetical protein